MGCGSSTDASNPANHAQNGGLNAPLSHPSKRVPSAGTNGVWKKPQQEVEHIELTEEVVKEYVELDKEIHKLEHKNVIKKYEAKQNYADEIQKTVDQLEATTKELHKQTAKEKADVDSLHTPSVSTFLKEQGTFDAKYNKEQQEYLDALQRQECADTELKGAKESLASSSKVAAAWKIRADKLNNLYAEQDRLLSGIFGGEYGSELENKLESELDDVVEWHQRVSLTKFKWTNSRVLLVHACTQMAFGVQRWSELKEVDIKNTRMRYFAAAEARNNFIAAGQNVQSARVYLGKVQFPYCTPAEMQQLEKRVHSAFTDIQEDASYKQSGEVYGMIHRKVAALIQWFDNVINDTINKDFTTSSNEMADKKKQLREERLKLIKLLCKEKLGIDLNIVYNEIDEEDEDDEELKALEAEEVSDHKKLPGKNLASVLLMTQPDRCVTPVPTEKMAATPSDEELFGNIKSLRAQHDKERTELEKHQALARAKMDQGLQAKLNQRRNHTDRMAGMKEHVEE